MNYIPIVIGAAGLYFLSQNKSEKTGEVLTNPMPIPTGTTDPLETGGGMTSGDSGVSGSKIDLSDFDNKVNYNWNGKEWLGFVQNLKSQGASSSDAIKIAFSMWTNPKNEKYFLFPTLSAFLIGIAQMEKNNLSRMFSADVEGINGVGNLITWNSIPLYDTWSNSWYGGYVPWTCADWKFWHQKLEQHYNSTQKANQLWEQAWGHSDNQCWAFGSVGCPDTSYCRTDCDWIEYFASKGVSNLQSLMLGTYCDVSNVALNITGTLSNISDGIANTSKAAKWAMPVLVGAAGYYLYKKYGAKK
jgi:hypothetical protein